MSAMQNDSSKRRYKLLNKIGTGSFANVYAARDVKLSREVAIKQLHEQYLVDKAALERYWGEAQLLSGLEHPNIMTIFDVVKSKGCLVLELMQGSLKEIYKEKPMPVEEVRQMLIQSAKGLDCLHGQGLIHGDIKPANLFLSKQEIVKLGDFGLARRVNDEEGSLVKGTTRYMAPELVSEDFGDVGPASDLYSLGFAALELLVGPNFDSLFPDLIAFGRDRQMAWMMWHCSADRKLPPVQSILQGVPDDLANVINKMIQKDQSQRYLSAKDVISDLSGIATPVGQSIKDEEAAALASAAEKKKKRRRLAIVACLMSLLVSSAIVAIKFWPKEEPIAWQAPPPVIGEVANVFALDDKLVLKIGNDWKEFKLLPGDKVTLNRKERQLRDLENGDRVVIRTLLNAEEKEQFDIVAFRPEEQSGVIETVDSENKKVVLNVTMGEEAKSKFELSVPDETPITLNALTKMGDEAMTMASLSKGDRVAARLADSEDGMVALQLDVLRDTNLNGYVRKVDLRGRTITVALDVADEDANSFVRIPLEPDCIISLNGLMAVDEKALKFSDVQPGDKVMLRHDVKVKQIDAYRIYYDDGKITNIDWGDQRFTIQSNSGGRKTYVVGECDLKLGEEIVPLADMRVGDTVKLSHDSPDDAEPELDTLIAARPEDRNKWAILIANGTFDSSSIPAISKAINDAKAIQKELNARYAVPVSQTFLCENFERIRIDEEVRKWIRSVPSGAELYVYLSTRAYPSAGEVYLAMRGSTADEIDENGVPLSELLDLLDECKTTKKVLLMDCRTSSKLSGVELVDVVRKTRRGGYPKSIYVLSSHQNGESSADASLNSSLSAFADAVARGFAGEADAAKDNLLDITELADFVEDEVMKNARSSGVTQRPFLVLPDASPPRISDRAKDSILSLLSHFSLRKIELESLNDAASRAASLAPSQPEPLLAHGILLIKATKMDNASEVLNNLRIAQPKTIQAHRGAIWIDFYKVRYDVGFEKLSQMFDYIPAPEEMEGVPYSSRTLSFFEWAGRLREIATRATWTERIPAPEDIKSFDQKIQGFGADAVAQFQAGRNHVQGVLAKFDEEIANDTESPARLQKKRIRSYMGSIANEDVINSIRETLDK